MASPVATYETVMAQVLALEAADQRRFLHELLKHCLGRAPRKGGAATKAGAAGGAGGGGNWWTAATKKASTVLAPLLAAKNGELSAAGKKKLPGTVAVILLKQFRDEEKVSKDAFPSDEEFAAAFQTYLQTHEPEDAKSTASKGSKGSKATSKGPKFSELSPEEQKARRSEAAKKAAAQRKANKAAQGGAAGGAAAPPAEEEAEEDEEEPAKPDYKEITIGKTKYLTVEHGGLTHVCDMEENWLGVLKGKKIVKKDEKGNDYASPFDGDDDE